MWWWKTWGLPYVNLPPAMISPEYKPSHKTCGLVKAETPSPTIAMAETLSTRIAQAFLLVPCQIPLLMAEFCISRRKLVWRVDSMQDWLRNVCRWMPSWISCRPRRSTNITITKKRRNRDWVIGPWCDVTDKFVYLSRWLVQKLSAELTGSVYKSCM